MEDEAIACVTFPQLQFNRFRNFVSLRLKNKINQLFSTSKYISEYILMAVFISINTSGNKIADVQYRAKSFS